MLVEQADLYYNCRRFPKIIPDLEISPHFILHVVDGAGRPSKAVAIEDSPEVEDEDCQELPRCTGVQQVEHHQSIFGKNINTICPSEDFKNQNMNYIASISR